MLADNFHLNNKAAGDSRSISKAFEMLKNLMDKLKVGAGDQTFAFGPDDDHFEVFFHKAIVLAEKLKFLNEGPNRFSLDTKRMITYDLILPFNNKNHDDENCIPAKSLTWFYKRKGRG